MKKIINKIIAGTMAAAIALSTGVTAFAADTQQITPGNTGSTTVKANVESEAVVWLPTNITISGTPDENNQYTGEGAVIVEGDIAGNEFISVTPESSISLKQSGKDDIIAQVTQEKTTFTYDDLQNSNSAVTSISTDTLSAGEWNSVLHYNVSLDEKSPLEGYTTLYKYDLSATKADDVKAYYLVPNKNTSPIEAGTEELKYESRTVDADNIIEYNGIRYVLSDEDELVISGEGEMKENIQADLMQYAAIQNAVCEHFNVKIQDYSSEMEEKVPYLQYSTNDLHPYDVEMMIDGRIYSATSVNPSETKDYLYQLMLDIQDYVDEISPNYIVSMPTSVTINEGIINISNLAFCNCTTLENIQIADSVRSIGKQAFMGCTNLAEISIPDSVTNIDMGAFNKCTKLTSIVIPDSITTINPSTFAACTNLTSISIPNSVVKIGGYAFYECKNLSSITIPDSVTSIDYWAFKNCSKLTSITIPKNVTELSGSAFDGCYRLTTLFLPKSIKTIDYKYGFSFTIDTIYCETQEVADLITGYEHFDSVKSYLDIIVDASMFS